MASIDRLLQMMIEKKASDLHLSSLTVPRFRLHGEMKPVEAMKEVPPESLQQLIDEISPETNKAEFLEKNDTDFAYEIQGLARFRVNVFRDRKGVGAVFRQIPAKILSFDDLNLPAVCKKFCSLSKGLVLVTGPTGSGKSTTLAAMIDHINESRSDHIITIEDPVEFVHPNKKCLVNQREIRTHTKGFKSALRAALREDPDIVLVGELRDLETTEIAIETAETGHLVFATLHTNTAISTIDRIINQFPADRQQQIRMMLAEALKGVVAQTLLKKADGSGRIAALEIMSVTSAISNNIREGKTHQIPSAMQTGKKFGMQLLNDDLARLVKEKLVTPEDAVFKCVDKEDMIGKLKIMGIDLTGGQHQSPAA
ncbi:MAG: pilT 3 [Bacteriovoracaceae bacterium]|nr:pilT 3 [Bacteriovoracaceae bacterium]